MLEEYNSKEVERKLIDFWEKEKIHKFDADSKKKVYSIDTPPATVTGDLHIGHLMSYTQMDFIARYKRMRGYNLFYPYGMDSNGLPTENFVEKEYGVVADRLGKEKFLELVEKTIESHQSVYDNIWRSIALSVDWSLYYNTLGHDEQRTSQLSFIELCGMGRAYRKETPALWCPTHKTTVSQIELEDIPEKTTLVYVKFSDDLTIATTRAELLPACVAIFVNPEDGKHAGLVGKSVRVPLFGNEVKVLADSRVDPEFGTGVVMCCTFGDQTDIEWYKAYNLELKTAINDSGIMTYGKYAGMKPVVARKAIIEELRLEGRVLKEEAIEHNIKVHERGKHPIEFMVKPQWFVKVLDMKEELLRLGNELKWHPEYMHIRYDNWVKGLQWDWCISRQRFFGIPFPVWYCKKCGEMKLAKKEQLPVNPLVDKPEGKCEKCGSVDFSPETDVLDTWATSSCTPLILARWATDKKYMGKIYPMSLRPQGNDIISFWLFTTIVKCYLHTKKLPWADAFISGYALDPKSRPMHKSLGNVIAALPAIEKYGADAIRYWSGTTNLGEDSSFQEKEMKSAQRLVNKLWNVAKFIEKTDSVSFDRKPGRVMDRWMLSKLQLLIKKATADFEEFNYAAAKRSVEEFFWSFSDNYLEFIKYRIYSGDKSPDYALNTVFFASLKLLAPFMPFITEEIYQKLYRDKIESGAPVSIHVSEWPVFEEKLLDQDSLKQGDEAQITIEFIRQWKHKNKFALNAELKEVMINKDFGETAEDIKGAMNIKALTKGEGSMQIPETDITVSITK